MNKTAGGEQQDSRMKWWQLSLLGVACTIGTGYFLGSGIAIEITGPSVILSFILAAFGTFMVFDVLARMTSENPLKGSFRSYAKKAYGHWAGFSSGWVYWSAELLIMGSQLTALSLFSRFWFPSVPMWLFASAYGVLGLAVILMGNKGFERVEHLFAVIKIAAIVMFLVIAGIALLGLIDGTKHQPRVPGTWGDFMPAGPMGLWSSLIYAFYAFGGIEIMGLMAMRLRNPADAPKAGRIMLLLLTAVYFLSLGLAVILIPWNAFRSGKSPFITALDNYNLPVVPHIFNAVLIIAGFSTMVASLFAVTTILVSLAEDRDAPFFFSKKWKRGLPLRALGLTTCGLAASIVMALLMPGSIYEYVTTAASLLLLYNWLFILVTSGRLLELTGWGQFKRYAGMALILLAVTGSWFHKTSRPGFWVSLIFIAVIGGVTLLKKKGFKRLRSKIKAESDERESRDHGNYGQNAVREEAAEAAGYTGHREIP
jgi:L-asparagine transporter-like permease